MGSSEGVARTLYLLCKWIVSVRAVDECNFLRLEEITFCQPFLGGKRPSSSSFDDDILCICGGLWVTPVARWPYLRCMAGVALAKHL